jgi:hypothetical protein
MGPSKFAITPIKVQLLEGENFSDIRLICKNAIVGFLSIYFYLDKGNF